VAENGRFDHMREHWRTIHQETRALKREVGAAWREGCEAPRLARAIQDHPIRTLLLAAGAGYVFGGGLLTPTTGRLLRVGLRAVALPLLRRQLISLAMPALH